MEAKIKRGNVENATIYLISSVVSFAISILVLPIYTRHLNPSDFGIVVLFGMFGKVVVGFVTFNLHFATYRYYFQKDHDPASFKVLYSTNFVFLFLIFIFSGIIVYFSSHWFASVLFDGQLTGKLIILSLVSGFLDYLFLYMTTFLTAQVKAIQFAIFTIANILLNTIFSLFFIYEFSMTYMARIYGILFSQVIVVGCLFIVTLNSFVMRFTYQSLKKSLVFTFPLIPQMILGLIQNSFDKTLLNLSKGATSLGYYSFGVNFAVVLKTIMDSVEKVWSPFFIKKSIENTPESKHEIVERFYAMAFFFMLIGLGVMYFSEEAIKILTTKEFYPAILVTPVYVYLYLFAIIGCFTNAQITVSEKMKYVLPSAFVNAVLNVILNLILIPRYGAIGAAGSASIAALFSQAILLYYGMKAFPLPLGKLKIAGLYILLIVFTIPIYPIVSADLPVVLKIGLKICILLTFVLFGLKLKFISKLDIFNILQIDKLINIRNT
jgi:O-antigen/teichoic acid export membrane protein